MKSTTTNKEISDKELDKKFDNGEDVLEYFDLEHPTIEHNSNVQKRVTFTMPEWIIEKLDKRAKILAISRNAVVNTLIAEKLESSKQN
ncbi:antitoxin [Gardnerella swidsinskii]|jgi:putative toxin-antitoxin system, antitoxin component, ribbon-helix-helix domain protein|uniref:Antitoxin n=1 Tax=Gardnerella swidsinskii TaxID=2792979 RepID=A0A9X7FF46_9BIFI|nr:hypothetical protein [Gardnerella swidsinskii]ADB13488.1 toxin-antitoxin system, antitoxin component, ribbon-helix-helix domain protein [Gardnerella vaginalis 409-05]NSX40652.1 antitoxin [Gardnerella vaginalis]PMC55030.1 antitoxin [Gardnerella swidsinskii]